MNKVFLIGRLTRDPELRYTGNNTAVATFSIAVNRNFSNANGERDADFINIVIWRKQAENASKYLTKGSQVAIDGRIQSRSYDDQNGNKRYITAVVADNIEFLGRPNGNGSSNTNSNVSNDTTNNNQNNNSEPTPYDFGDNSGDMSTTSISNSPFEDFGQSLEMDGIDNSELPFY